MRACVCMCPRVCFNPVFFSSVVWKGGLNIEQPVDCERWSIIQRLDRPLFVPKQWPMHSDELSGAQV